MLLLLMSEGINTSKSARLYRRFSPSLRYLTAANFFFSYLLSISFNKQMTCNKIKGTVRTEFASACIYSRPVAKWSCHVVLIHKLIFQVQKCSMAKPLKCLKGSFLIYLWDAAINLMCQMVLLDRTVWKVVYGNCLALQPIRSISHIDKIVSSSDVADAIAASTPTSSGAIVTPKPRPQLPIHRTHLVWTTDFYAFLLGDWDVIAPFLSSDKAIYHQSFWWFPD